MLSAFLDALTVTAVVITVAAGFYGVYHRVASGKHFITRARSSDDEDVENCTATTSYQFRAFLRSLVMHAAVGTALGGVTTLVGEPQNLLIATVAGWDFVEFFLRMAPVSVPVLGVGLRHVRAARALALVRLRRGLPEPVRVVLGEIRSRAETRKRTPNDARCSSCRPIVAFLLVALAFHWPPSA